MQLGPRIRFDKHTLGNLVKNVSPALAFTPLGLAGVAGASALGDIGRGKHNALDIAKGAAGNVAIGAGARGVAGHFGVGPSANPGPLPTPHAAGVTAPTPAAIGTAPDLTTAGGLPSDSTLLHASASKAASPLSSIASGMSDASDLAPEVTGVDPSSYGGGSSGILSKIASAGNWAGNHDKTTAAVLGGLGNLGTMGTENRTKNAQARLLEQQAQEGEYDYNRRKASDLALEPLRQALYGKLGSLGTIGQPAGNPYATAGA